jgi:hypothetical protein
MVSYLLNPDSIPFDRPPHFALQSREEAAYVAETLGAAGLALPPSHVGRQLSLRL